MEASAVLDQINRLQLQLDIVRSLFPRIRGCRRTAFATTAGSKDWGAFFMLHTWMFQVHIDLYRFALPGIREQATAELLAASRLIS